VSRCQRYDLRRIRTAEIVERLAEITREEKIAISTRACSRSRARRTARCATRRRCSTR
jgi:DNA polymerase III gamma/tau subunit